MINWLTIPETTRKATIDQVSFQTGFSPNAIEKDWYVTLALNAVFQTPWAGAIVFKGGTSLSKGWQLITRFSEDIDLAIHPSALGFKNTTFNKGQVRKLRKASADFMGGEFLAGLTDILRAMGVTSDMLTISIEDINSSDVDPRIIELEYPTLYPTQTYVRSKVLLEVGARSLREPFTQRPIISLISEHFPKQSFAVAPFSVPTVNPDRTMLEKMFLLHEEFTKPVAKIRHERLSRHLYDIHSLLSSKYGAAALGNEELFSTIRNHRNIFNPHPHVDYLSIRLQDLVFVPPTEVIVQWENDYSIMRSSMLGDGAPTFADLINILQQVTTQLRKG